MSWRRECGCEEMAAVQQHAGTRSELIRSMSSLVFACHDCGTIIKGYRRIGLLNWLLHGSRCPSCGIKFKDRRILPQLIVVPLTVFAVLRMGIEPQLPLMLFQLWGWATVAYISLKHQLMPDVLTYLLLWSSLLASALGISIPIEDAVIGAVVCYLSQWLFFHTYKIIGKREILAYGNFKGGAAIGAFLGSQIGMAAIVGAYALKCAENKIRTDKLLTDSGLLPLGHWLAVMTIAFGLSGG